MLTIKYYDLKKNLRENRNDKLVYQMSTFLRKTLQNKNV